MLSYANQIIWSLDGNHSSKHSDCGKFSFLGQFTVTSALLPNDWSPSRDWSNKVRKSIEGNRLKFYEYWKQILNENIKVKPQWL